MKIPPWLIKLMSQHLESKLRQRWQLITGKPLDLTDAAAVDEYASWAKAESDNALHGNPAPWLQRSMPGVFRKSKRPAVRAVIDSPN